MSEKFDNQYAENCCGFLAICTTYSLSEIMERIHEIRLERVPAYQKVLKDAAMSHNALMVADIAHIWKKE